MSQEKVVEDYLGYQLPDFEYIDPTVRPDFFGLNPIPRRLSKSQDGDNLLNCALIKSGRMLIDGAMLDIQGLQIRPSIYSIGGLRNLGRF